MEIREDRSLSLESFKETTSENKVFSRRFFMSSKKGTVPKAGEGILPFVNLSVDRISWLSEGPKGRISLGFENGEAESQLVFSRGQILSLKSMIDGVLKGGVSKPKGREGTKASHEVVDLEIGLSRAKISVVAKKPEPDDISFGSLLLKDRRGGRLHLDLGLKVARQIKKKLDRYFAKEGPKQIHRLAHIKEIWQKNAEENEARSRKSLKVFMSFVEAERAAQEARLA